MLLIRRAFLHGIGVLIVCSVVSSFHSSFGADSRKCYGICALSLGHQVRNLAAYAASNSGESGSKHEFSVSINIDGSEPEEIVLHSAADCYAEAHRIAEKHYEGDQDMLDEIQTGLLEQWKSRAGNTVLLEDDTDDVVPASEGLVLDMNFDGGVEQVQLNTEDAVYSEAWRLAETHFGSDLTVYEDLLAQLMSKWKSWLTVGMGGEEVRMSEAASARIAGVAEPPEFDEPNDLARLSNNPLIPHEGGFSIDMNFEGGVTEQVVLRCEDDIYTEATRIVGKHFEFSQEVLEMVQSELAQQWLKWFAGQSGDYRE